MALFGHDYDRGYSNRRGWRGWQRGNASYDDPFRGHGVWDLNEPAWGTAAYDAGYQYTRGEPGDLRRPRYDRGYGSRWQTDQGDPFGDRSARTPMRVIRGGYRGGQGRRRDWESRYGRDYSARPTGYDPYQGQDVERDRGSRWMRYDQGFWPYGGVSGTGWF